MIKLTKELAWAAGHDAGTASMRKGNRKKWSLKDYNAAVKVINRLLDVIEGSAQ